jgi:hypothetical protein
VVYKALIIRHQGAVSGQIRLAERDRTRIMGLVWGAQVLGADSGSDPRGARRLDVF